MGDLTVESNEQWSEIITPKTGLFKLGLKEVWRYRDLLLLFVKRDLAAQYKQTVLGPVWYIIQPVFTSIMFFIIFNRIANIATAPVPPELFYMSSITIWTYFSTCLSSTSSTFVANASIFGKVYFPRLVLPLSVVLSNIAKFGIQFCLLIVLIIYDAVTGRSPANIGLHTLLIPVIVVIMAGMGLGLGIIISSLTTKYRDFNILVSFGVQLLMYVTPVAYPLAVLQARRASLFALLRFNPLSPLVEGFRYALFGTGMFNAGLFLYSILFTCITLFIGIVIFNKVERSFMDTV
jgi:lipopolysaccharide transport system permease protein